MMAMGWGVREIILYYGALEFPWTCLSRLTKMAAIARTTTAAAEIRAGASLKNYEKGFFTARLTSSSQHLHAGEAVGPE